VEKGVRGASRSTLYRWSRPDADRETTRGSPGLVVRLILPAGPGYFTEQRAVSSSSTATDPATSTSSTPRGRTIT